MTRELLRLALAPTVPQPFLVLVEPDRVREDGSGEADPGNNSRRSRRTSLYQTASQSPVHQHNHCHHHPRHHLHHVIVTIHSSIIFIIVITIIIPRTITTTVIFSLVMRWATTPQPFLTNREQNIGMRWVERYLPSLPPCPSHPPTREAMCVGTPGGEV